MNTIQHEKTGETLAHFRGMPPRLGECVVFEDDSRYLVTGIDWSFVDDHLHATVKVRQA